MLHTSNFQEDFTTISFPSPRLSGLLLLTVTAETNPTALNIELPKHYTRMVLDAMDNVPIMDMLVKLEKHQRCEIEVNTLARRYTAVSIDGEKISARKNQSLSGTRNYLVSYHHPFQHHLLIQLPSFFQLEL